MKFQGKEVFEIGGVFMDRERSTGENSIDDILEATESLVHKNDEYDDQIKVYPIDHKTDNKQDIENNEDFDIEKLNLNIQNLIKEKKNEKKENFSDFEDFSSSYEHKENVSDIGNNKFQIPNSENKEKQRKNIYHSRKFTVFGKEKDEQPDLEFIKKRNFSVIEDYKKTGDIPYIKTQLNKEFHSLFIKAIISVVFMLLVLIPTIIIRIDSSLPSVLFQDKFPLIFSAFCFIILISSFCLMFKDMVRGLVSLFRLEGDCDSAVAFASVCAGIQLIAAMIFPNRFVLNGKYPIYACISLIGLFLNLLGKLFISARVRRNFLFVSSPIQKYSVKLCTDIEQARRVSRSAYNEKTNICYQQKTDFLSDFLKLSYAPDSSDYLAYSTALLGAGLSIVIAIIAGFMKGDVLYAITSLALSSCVCIPMSTILTINMQLWSLCKKTLKKGSMISGFWALRRFSEINSIVVDANNLYPKGSIVLKGIKTFGTSRIDKALLSATAMLIDIDSPLKYVFDEIIQGRKNLLPIVDSVEYIDGQGVVGWSEGERMLIGNSKLLKKFMVDTPSSGFESKYKAKGYDITYFASAGKVFAAFILKYNPDVKIMEEVQRLEYDGINILVRTVDSNITVERIADNFDVYFKTVKILPIEISNDFKSYLVHPENKSKAYIASNGRIDSVIRAVSGCNRMKSNIGLSMAIQIVAMIIGFLLTALLIFYSKLEQVGCLELIIFVAFWIFAVLIPPRIRKP